MSVIQRIKASYLDAGLGIIVERPSAADAAGWVSIYQILGGFVQITGLYAIVTVVHVGALCQVGFRHSAPATNLCTLTNLAAAAVGTIVTITGDPADGAAIGLGTGVLNTAAPVQGGMKGGPTSGIQSMGLVCGVGNIQVDWTVVTSGSTRYVLSYIPIDVRAYVI